MRYRLILWFTLLFVFIVQIPIAAEEEIIFEPISLGNFAVIHLSDDQLFIINTGDSSSQYQIKQYLDSVEPKRIKGILVTKTNHLNCGNLDFILNHYDVDQVYLPSKNCEVPHKDQSKVFILKGHSKLAITSKFFMEYMIEDDSSYGNFAISNGKVVSFWYGGPVKPNDWNQNVQILYLSDDLPSDDVLKSDLLKLDPEVAVINQSNPTESFINLLQEQWIDLYFLRNGVEVHISMDGGNEYELYLRKQRLSSTF